MRIVWIAQNIFNFQIILYCYHYATHKRPSQRSYIWITWVSISQKYYEPDFYYCHQYILSSFPIISLWKRAWHFTWTKNGLCQVWLKLAQWIRKRWTCEKIKSTKTMRYNRHISIKNAHLSLWLWWDIKKMSLSCIQNKNQPYQHWLEPLCS